MSPRGGAVALALAVSLVVAAGGCGGSRAPFEARTFAEVEEALTEQGLQICGVEPSGARANQAADGRAYRVAVDCTGEDDATVVVDRFDSAAHRDAAARNLEGQVRPRAGGAVWTLGPFAVVVSGPTDDDVVNRVTDALENAGAS